MAPARPSVADFAFGSVCTGLGSAELAWCPLGWRPQFFAEFDPSRSDANQFPSMILAHHHPEVPNLGDITQAGHWPDHRIHVLVGGTPCQSYSIAGLRKGMADPRGNLTLAYLGIADRYRPHWLVWENVPGVLSSDVGRDFRCFILGLARLGYGWAYRVLDAQYFRVAQRRQRVFVVGCLGGWARAAAVLFDPASMRGDPAPRRQAGQRNTGTLTARVGAGGGLGTDFELAGGLQVSSTLLAQGNRTGGSRPPGSTVDTVDQLVAGTLTAHHGNPRAEDAWGGKLISGAVTSKWRKGTGGPAGDECYNLVPFDTTQITCPTNRSRPEPGDPSPTLAKSSHPPSIAGTVGVRRLTPRECERLQGYPDDYTLIPVKRVMRPRPGLLAQPDQYREINGEVWKLAADGPRYEAIGNGMATPVMEWIGRRIAMVDAL